MKTRKIIIKALILFTVVLFVGISSKLDLLKDNFSTLSLTTKGYFIFLFMGILSGILNYIITLKISGKKCAIIVLLSLFIGTLIPHDISYNLQGNLHMLNAYLGFIGLEIITFINIYNYSLSNNKKGNVLKIVYFICLFLAIYSYTLGMFVNTLSELFIILSNLFVLIVIY